MKCEDFEYCKPWNFVVQNMGDKFCQQISQTGQIGRFEKFGGQILTQFPKSSFVTAFHTLRQFTCFQIH